MTLSIGDKKEAFDLDMKEIHSYELPTLFSRIFSKQILSEEIRKKIEEFRKKESFEFNELLIMLDICFFSVIFNLNSVEVITDIDWSVFSKQKDKEIIKIKQETYEQILTQESLKGISELDSRNMNMFQNINACLSFAPFRL